MDLTDLSIKHLSDLEQQTSQLLKTMRSAKLYEHDIYTQLKELEEALSVERRSRYDDSHNRYDGY